MATTTAAAAAIPFCAPAHVPSLSLWSSSAAETRFRGRPEQRRLAASGRRVLAGVRVEALSGGGGGMEEAMVPPYNVLITGSTKAERVESAASNLKKEFGDQHVWGTVCHVREGKDVKALVDFAHDKLKYIDLWVPDNKAGEFIRKEIEALVLQSSLQD